jgi:hypothetical protein
MTDLIDTEATAVVDAGLYQQIQHFYARHMQSVDAGDAVAWARGFTLDGVFDSNVLPAPVVGRAAIESATLAGEARRPAGLVRRHVLSMLAVFPGETSVRTRSYVTVLETLPGQPTAMHCSTLLEDELVRGGDFGWMVRNRHIVRDDLPPKN